MIVVIRMCSPEARRAVAHCDFSSLHKGYSFAAARAAAQNLKKDSHAG
jgi:hypothetical protein